jgi:cytoskeletal protein CcmA (bactofilin family)
MKLFRLLFSLLLFVIVLQRAPLAAAFEVRSGDSASLAHDQVVNSSMLAAGESVTIDGIVRGDVFCAGQRITISGLVDGDVLCAGQSIVISGVVTGNTRLMGQTIDIQGTVRRNASIVGQTVTLTGDGSINGEMLLAGQTLALDGLIGKGLNVAGQTVELNGRVNGDVWTANQTVTVGEKAIIGGNFKYTSQNQTQIPKTASISGVVTFTQAEREKGNKSITSSWKQIPKSSPVNLLTGILWNMFIVFLLVLFFPKKVQYVVERMKNRPLWTGFIGFLALIILPMLGILLALTIIGIPFAVIWFILYALVVGISRSFAAVMVGGYVIESFFTKLKNRRFVPVLIGVPVLWLIFHTPFIGGLISFLMVCWGMGGMVRTAKSLKK